MALTCGKFPRPWTTFRRTLSARSQSGINENRPHSSSMAAVSTTADVSSDFDHSPKRQGKKKEGKRRAVRDFENDDRRLHSEDSVVAKPSASFFDDFIANHVRSARRSLLIRFSVRSPQQYDEAYHEICKQLEKCDVCVVPSSRTVHSPDGQKTFFLLETTSPEPLNRFVQHYARSAVADDRLLPCRSRILHFTADLNGGQGNSRPIWNSKNASRTVPGTDELALNKALKDCLWIDEQMRVLVDETTLTEYGARLRFFVASLIEDAFRGVFPLSVCTPFGSTTNGFGDSNSDLDLDFAVEDPLAENVTHSNWLCAFRLKDEDARKHTQNMIELFGRMVRSCIPYCGGVTRILHARVPIVKFSHDAGGFECDLTFDNVTGIACAKILWIYSRIDHRIRPLAFTIRRWAAALKITREAPGGWITNFQLLCLVIHFLQSRSSPSSGHNLPPIRTLRRLASFNDSYGIVSDPERLSSSPRSERAKGRSSNSELKTDQESLGDLLRDFFLFYGHSFVFDRFGISLDTGLAFEKVDLSQPLFIDNPLEVEHNIAKNVTESELNRFRSCARKALKIMESKELMERNASNSNSWGLLALWDPSRYDKVEETSENSQSGVLLIDDVEIDI